MQQTIVTEDGSTAGETEAIGAEKTGTGNSAAPRVIDKKSGRRNASSDQSALDQAHDLLVEAGANCTKMVDDTDESKAAEVESAKQRHASARPDLRLLVEAAELEEQML